MIDGNTQWENNQMLTDPAVARSTSRIMDQMVRGELAANAHEGCLLTTEAQVSTRIQTLQMPCTLHSKLWIPLPPPPPVWMKPLHTHQERNAHMAEVERRR